MQFSAKHWVFGLNSWVSAPLVWEILEPPLMLDWLRQNSLLAMLQEHVSVVREQDLVSHNDLVIVNEI